MSRKNADYLSTDAADQALETRLDQTLAALADEPPPMPQKLHETWMAKVREEARRENSAAGMESAAVGNGPESSLVVTERTKRPPVVSSGLIRVLSAAAVMIFLVGGTLAYRASGRKMTVGTEKSREKAAFTLSNATTQMNDPEHSATAFRTETAGKAKESEAEQEEKTGKVWDSDAVPEEEMDEMWESESEYLPESNEMWDAAASSPAESDAMWESEISYPAESDVMWESEAAYHSDSDEAWESEGVSTVDSGESWEIEAEPEEESDEGRENAAEAAGGANAAMGAGAQATRSPDAGIPEEQAAPETTGQAAPEAEEASVSPDAEAGNAPAKETFWQQAGAFFADMGGFLGLVWPYAAGAVALAGAAYLMLRKRR